MEREGETSEEELIPIDEHGVMCKSIPHSTQISNGTISSNTNYASTNTIEWKLCLSTNWGPITDKSTRTAMHTELFYFLCTYLVN
jgi:hypothetical protein